VGAKPLVALRQSINWSDRSGKIFIDAPQVIDLDQVSRIGRVGFARPRIGCSYEFWKLLGQWLLRVLMENGARSGVVGHWSYQAPWWLVIR